MTEDTWLGSPGGVLGPLLLSDLDVPSKTRRTSGGQLGLLAAQSDAALEPFQDGGVAAAAAEESRDQDGLAELFLHVPSNFSWNKPQHGNPPLFRYFLLLCVQISSTQVHEHCSRPKTLGSNMAAQ